MSRRVGADTHSLLKRQIKKHLDPCGDIPAEWLAFARAVDDAYRQFDADRQMLERSLELSSQELLQANSELRVVLRTFPDLVFRLNADGRILDIKGDKASELQDLVGRAFWDMPTDDAGPALRCALAGAATRQSIVSVEYSFTSAGRVGYFEARLFPLPSGDIIAIVREITERRTIERALRESERQLADAQRVARIGSWERDLRGNRMTWSDEMFRLLEVDPSTSPLTVDAALDATHPDDRAMVARVMNGASRDGDEGGVHARVPLKDGSVRIVHWRGTVAATDRPSTMMLGTVQDATDLKNAEEALRHAHDELESRVEERTAALTQAQEQLRQAEKMQAIGTLAGGIAHDFNNILGAMMGHAQLALMDAGGHPAMTRSLNEVVTAGRRASQLVEKILTFSRQREEVHEVIHLAPVIDEALGLLRSSLPASIEIRSRLDFDAPPVFADTTAIHQVVMNLGSNAWHAMGDASGVLEVTLDVVDVDADLAGQVDMRGGRHARLTVRDTGHGMDRATQERIFEPFFTTKPPGQGTGLGLATVHGIVTNHGGAIRVDSRPGEGTAFQLFFPARGTGVVGTEVAIESVPRGEGQHVLLVDDEVALVSWGREVLERLGYRVTGHSNALDALEEVTSRHVVFDVVVTDWTMPFLSGLDLATKLQASCPGLPIILTTGHVGELTADDIRRHGILEVMIKPNTVDALAAAVRRALTAGRAVARASV